MQRFFPVLLFSSLAFSFPKSGVVWISFCGSSSPPLLPSPFSLLPQMRREGWKVFFLFLLLVLAPRGSSAVKPIVGGAGEPKGRFKVGPPLIAELSPLFCAPVATKTLRHYPSFHFTLFRPSREFCVTAGYALYSDNNRADTIGLQWTTGPNSRSQNVCELKQMA